MRSFTIGSLAVLSLFAMTGFLQAQPASISDETKRFVAVAIAGSNFVDEAGNTALANGGSPALQRFARRAIADQRAMRTRLAPWAYVLTPTPAQPIVYQGMWDYGPIGLAFLPLNAAVAATSAIVFSAFGVTSGGVVLQSDAAARLGQMQSLSGAEFNAAYRASQNQAYRSLVDLYSSYARSGDDPAIRQLATNELVVLQRRLGSLPR